MIVLQLSEALRGRAFVFWTVVGSNRMGSSQARPMLSSAELNKNECSR